MQRYTVKTERTPQNSSSRVYDEDGKIAASFANSEPGRMAYNLFTEALARAGGSLFDVTANQIKVGQLADLIDILPQG